MKKLFFTLMIALTAICGLRAQNSEESIAWKDAVEEFRKELNANYSQYTEPFVQMGVDAKLSCDYEAATRTIVLDIRFEPNIWHLFTQEVVNEAGKEMLDSYRESYKTDPDFRDFVRLMQSNKGKLDVQFSCVEGGKVKTKRLSITPQDIMK